MKTKLFFFSVLTAGIATYAYIRHAKQLKLIYNIESGQLIIDVMQRMKCCNEIYIENIIVFLNGEVYKGFDYSEFQKSFDDVIFIDIPHLEEGDMIEVEMKTRCTRSYKKWGRLQIV